MNLQNARCDDKDKHKQWAADGNEQQDKRTETVQMKCVTSVEGLTLCDRKTHEEIITSARGQDISKLAYEYVPTGKRNVDRPRRRWTDQQPRKQNKPGMLLMTSKLSCYIPFHPELSWWHGAWLSLPRPSLNTYRCHVTKAPHFISTQHIPNVSNYN